MFLKKITVIEDELLQNIFNKINKYFTFGRIHYSKNHLRVAEYLYTKGIYYSLRKYHEFKKYNFLDIDIVLSNIYLNRGDARFRLTRFQSALNDFQNALQYNPNSYLAYHNIGTVFYFMNKPQHSIMSLDKAMQMARQLQVRDPEYFSALFSDRGKINFDEKNYHTAYQDFRKCLKLTPGFADINYFLALVSLKLGKFTIAQKAFLNTLRANPTENQRESIILALKNRLKEENEYNTDLNRFMHEFIDTLKKEKLLLQYSL